MEPGPPLADIACYVLVAQRMSFSGAARELGMSQPAVSQTIARLERTLDLRLFDRSSRQVQLTEAGKLLLPHAEELLDRARAFTAEATRLALPTGGSIRLAYCPLTGTLAAQVAQRLGQRTPPIKVELRPTGWSSATAELARDAVAIMSAPFPPGLAYTGRFHIPITHLAVAMADPLAGAARVHLGQLARRTLLMPRSRPPGSVWAQLIARLRAEGIGFQDGDEHDNWTTALDLVAARRGVLPTPAPLAGTVRRPDLAFVPFDAGLTMTYGIVWSAEYATAQTLALVQAIQSHLRLTGRSAPAA
ncbi:LysR family transcriptional regulator [Allorhizocola rhizosphaerae]|uniref:LysR family transcriptional regulator n=1 Tax=Allorhizocola rhizosphaerae TaxID=1872709 RepID=UPI000E3CF131|nr:LysR family transcriptional regulator [Allorhizocola rhizosphaerae]